MAIEIKTSQNMLLYAEGLTSSVELLGLPGFIE
jgi:hypothetical protein